MKQKTPFPMIKNALNDMRAMHDFTYTVPTETIDDFWEKECSNYPTSSTCKIYKG
tara:strand:+ start:341 stop:505 length:165 start_codon:yes stop_codon:yes gene_type:complete